MFKKKNDEKIDFKIVSKEEAIWTKVRDARRQRIASIEEELIIERALLELAESKIRNTRK